MRDPRATSRAGFTLIELTLATATAAVLALALYASLGVAMKARDAANRTVELDRQANLVADLVTRDLEATLPPIGTLAGPFVGTVGPGGSALSFHAFPPRHGDGTGDLPERIEFEFRTDVAPAVLVRRHQPNLLAPTEAELDEELLARGVVRFTLRYYDGAAWVDTWDSGATDATTELVLPLAVELTIVLERASDTAREPERATVVRVVNMPFGSDVAPETDEEGAST